MSAGFMLFMSSRVSTALRWRTPEARLVGLGSTPCNRASETPKRCASQGRCSVTRPASNPDVAEDDNVGRPCSIVLDGMSAWRGKHSMKLAVSCFVAGVVLVGSIAACGPAGNSTSATTSAPASTAALPPPTSDVCHVPASVIAGFGSDLITPGKDISNYGNSSSRIFANSTSCSYESPNDDMHELSVGASSFESTEAAQQQLQTNLAAGRGKAPIKYATLPGGQRIETLSGASGQTTTRMFCINGTTLWSVDDNEHGKPMPQTEALQELADSLRCN